MQPIIDTIKLGEQGEVVTNLHEILHFFVEREILKIAKDEWERIVPDFKPEQVNQFYGKITGNLVVLFRMQNNLGDGRDVDDATVKAINALLDIPQNNLIVKGRVFFADDKPAPGIMIRAFDKDIRSLQPLGENITDDKGSYEIWYPAEKYLLADEGTADIMIIIYDKNGIETLRSDIYYNAPPVATPATINCLSAGS